MGGKLKRGTNYLETGFFSKMHWLLKCANKTYLNCLETRCNITLQYV